MAYVRRHGWSLALYLALLMIGVLVWLAPTWFLHNDPQTAHAQLVLDQPEAVDPYLYTQVQQLREVLALTDRDLAAMGCTEETATVLLETLKSWCQTNQAKLDQQQLAELQANAAVRKALRQNSVSDDARISDTLPALLQNVAQLQAQRKAMTDSLAALLATRMDAGSLGTWQIARGNVNLPDTLRYVPDLSDKQRQAIHEQLLDRSSQGDLETVYSQTLTFAQKQALEAARLTTAVRFTNVKAAETQVLPAPAILKSAPVLLVADPG